MGCWLSTPKARCKAQIHLLAYPLGTWSLCRADQYELSWSAELLLLGVCLGVIFFSFPLLLREGCHSMWVLRGLPCGIGWIGAGCHRGVMCTFLLTLQGQPYVGAGGSFQLPPLSTLLSKQEQAIQTHTPNGRLAGRVLLRATSCVCVCVIRCLQF